MRLPRKIDDRLKDAIVNIQFSPAVPPETVAGYAHALLKDKFEIRSGNPFPAFGFSSSGLTIEHKPFYFLSKDGQFRIDIDSQSLTFNLVKGYAGWTAYREVIEQCVPTLFTGNLIRHVNRLGVRYISQFDSVRIRDSVDISLRVGSVPDDRRGQLRLEFIHNGLQTILTLVDGFPSEKVGQRLSDADFFSLVDLDIIKSYPPEQLVTSETLLSHIEDAHHEEKTLFFNLLKQDFLQTLNPVY